MYNGHVKNSASYETPEQGGNSNIVEVMYFYTNWCPHCKNKQIPRFDINLANNAIELDPNIVALYGEGMDDDDDDDCALDDDEEDEEDEDEEEK